MQVGPCRGARARDLRARALDELAHSYGATPLADPSELAADIWASDEELDAFIADVRASRAQSLA